MRWTNWKKERFLSGSVVFSEGEMGSTAYLIEYGEIEIAVQRSGKKKILATLTKGDLLGEIALIDQYQRTATAIALSDTSLIPITREVIEKKLANADPLLNHLLNLVVGRYRGMRDKLSDEDKILELKPPPHAPNDTLSQTLKEYAIGQIKLAQDINEAIDREDFKLHYQPIVRLEGNEIAGFEALIRWDRPRVGFVPPPEFICLAEDTGQIIPMGRWIISTACEQLKTFQEIHAAHHPDKPPLFMSINLSAIQLQEAGEVNQIISIIKQSSIDAVDIKLEITETVIIDDHDIATIALWKLKETGLQLTIDDFGTGYSSLTYLEQFPLDSLKIDQSFVATMTHSEGSQRIIRALVKLSKEFSMDCIAEGIEQPEEAQLLRDLGCEYGQGYLFGRPLTPTKANEFIRQ